MLLKPLSWQMQTHALTPAKLAVADTNLWVIIDLVFTVRGNIGFEIYRRLRMDQMSKKMT